MSPFTVSTGRRDPDAVGRLLAALPDWFGVESANEGYVRAARRLPTYLASDPTGTAVGVLLVERHFPETAEVHLVLVDPAWHRQGVGRALLRAAEADLRAEGVRLLEVKTLGPSDPSEPYARTRRFYAATGFLPVEELHGLWPDDPCLVLVKPLDDHGRG